MKTVISLSIVILLFFLSACGNKKSPTGGPIDQELPVIAAIFPEPFSDISGKNIEITFSKHIERSSATSGERGIHLPDIDSKRIRWDDTTLTIEIQETLIPNRNYFLSLSQNITDLRRNQLDKTYTYIYHTGELSEKSILGAIHYEKEEDKNYPVTFNVLSADSLFIFRKEIRGTNYLIENLNYEEYILQAFIDKNNNQRYDLNSEPFFQALADSTATSRIDLKLEYFDDRKPEIKNVKANFLHLLSVSFNKEIKSIQEITITTADSLMEDLGTAGFDYLKNEIEIITAPMDSLEYKIVITNVEDFKGNIAEELTYTFTGSSEIDTKPPQIIGTEPRNGAVVDTLTPEIIIQFSKYMFSYRINVELLDTITGNKIPTIIIPVSSRQIMVQPMNKLNERQTYKLTVLKTTRDTADLHLEENYELNFIPIIR